MHYLTLGSQQIDVQLHSSENRKATLGRLEIAMLDYA
jgi:hypothetical protein